MTDSPETMSLHDVMYNCRAMRKLDTRDVPEEMLIKLVDAANQAPSGSNMQGMRWLVVRDADQRAKIAELNKTAVEAYLQMQAASAESLPHQDAEKRKRMFAAVKWQADNMQNIPALMIACYVFDEPVPPEMAAFAGASVWPGVQNLLLTARAMGLGAAPTTLGLTDRKAFKDVVNMPENIEPYALVPVGWPLGNFGPVTRLPVEETIIWDKWD